jgi:hypothetical protein
MTDNTKSEIFRAALEAALKQLSTTLNEAQSYLDDGQDLATIGTLISLDEQVADLNAALRLFRRNPTGERKPCS